MKILLPISFYVFLGLLSSQVIAQKVRYSAPFAEIPPVLDGIENDACWTSGQWGHLNQQWFSDRPVPDSADFYGRYKATWTSDKIYLLVEITDDVFNDDIEDPLNNYWEEDCLEVFIDEDKSGGDHKCCTQAYNAFAYHTSPVTYDVVDLSDDGDFVPKLFNDNVSIVTKSTGNLHVMELAIKIFDDTYNEDDTNTPLTLTKDKLLGFSIAYCEDDGNGREDFMATQSGGLDSWMDADLFGELLLLPSVTSISDKIIPEIIVYPNPTSELIQFFSRTSGNKLYRLFNSTGMLIQSGYSINANNLDYIKPGQLPVGLYYLYVVVEGKTLTGKVLISEQ